MSMIRAVIKIPTRGVHLSAASLGPKKKKGGKGGGGGKQIVVKQRPASTVLGFLSFDFTLFMQDFEHIVTHCAGLNVWSKAFDFGLKEEDAETFFDDPVLRPHEEYPEWLFDPKLLLDLEKIELDDVDMNEDPEMYWKRFQIELDKHEHTYLSEKRWLEGNLEPPHVYTFLTHFPDIEIQPRPRKLKNKLIRSAPYANQ